MSIKYASILVMQDMRVRVFRIRKIRCKFVWTLDLAYFTTWVPDTCDTNAKQTTRVRHECNTSTTRTARVKKKDFHNDTSEKYFHTPILAISQMKDNKERSNFFLRTTFSKCLVSMATCIWKVHHKNWTL